MARSMFAFQFTALLRKVAGHRFEVGSSIRNHYREAGICFDGKYICACERNEMPRNDVPMRDRLHPERVYLWRGWREVLRTLTLSAGAVQHIPRAVRAKLLTVAEKLGYTHWLKPHERSAVLLP